MKEITLNNDPKFMASGVTDAIKNVIKELCKRLSDNNTNNKVTYIEIGIWYGGTFKEILHYCTDNNLNVHGIGIDFFEDFDLLNGNDINTHVDSVITLESAKLEYEKEGLKNFTLLKGDSAKTLRSLELTENVVCFIDANHTYEAVKADFLAAESIMKNGYIILDDCNEDEHADGQYGIYRFFKEIKDQYKIVYKDSRNVAFKIR
jgi:hypothetical protein